METEGFNEFIRLLENSKEEVKENAKKTTKSITAKVLRKVKLKTPVGKENGGTLRRSWHSKKINDYTYIVYNNLSYSSHVEFGHRTRLGTGTSPNYKPKGKIKFVPGVYMLKRAIDETSTGTDFEFSKIIENLWEEK